MRLVGHKRPDALEALAAFPFPEVLEMVDPIPKQEACGMMRAVDGLLLLNPAGLRRYIQGKLYEYIASGTPIVVFGAGGEMGEIVDSLGAGTTVAEGDAAGLAKALDGLRARRNSDPEQRRKWLDSRERAVLAGVLYRQLDMLIDASPERALTCASSTPANARPTRSSWAAPCAAPTCCCMAFPRDLATPCMAIGSSDYAVTPWSWPAPEDYAALEIKGVCPSPLAPLPLVGRGEPGAGLWLPGAGCCLISSTRWARPSMPTSRTWSGPRLEGALEILRIARRKGVKGLVLRA
jgi:hypothetical protein